MIWNLDFKSILFFLAIYDIVALFALRAIQI
jgi:hypothetical protein